MKKVITILILLNLTLNVLSQNDSIRANKQLKEAPESLKKMIEGIKAQNKEGNKDADIEIDGLLFDETKTRSGRDFYDYFFNHWLAPKNAKNYSIFIVEKPYRLTTTLIEVKINETTVYQMYSQPRSDVELIALEAAQQTRLYLQNYEEILRQLAGEDQSGSGIY